MPQWRKLHTKTVESLDLNDMPDDFHRLLWVLLPLVLDCEGRGLDNPAWVKSKAMPLRTDIDINDVTQAMDWYADRGMIRRYQVAGRRYFWVPTFAKYQGNTSREAPSEYPAPPSRGCPDDESGPEPDDPDDGAGQDQLTSESRVSQDQLRSKSGTDADAEVDAESEPEPAAAAARAREGPPGLLDFDLPEPEQARSSAFAAYERACGPLSPLIADRIGALVDEFEQHRATLARGSPGSDVSGDEWVVAAVEEMAASNPDRRSLNYVQAILDRWRKDGYQSQYVKPGTAGNGRRQNVRRDATRPKDDGSSAEAFARAKAERKRRAATRAGDG